MTIDDDNQEQGLNLPEDAEETNERELPDVRLRSVDALNWRACVDMSVTSEQEGSIVENWYSLLQWKFSENLYPFCVYAQETMVGFLMYELNAENNRWGISRLMIDAKHQNKGYGRSALLRLLDVVGEFLSGIAFYAYIDSENEDALKLFESVGFEKTGEDHTDEIVLKIIL